jgi:uncharacterized membrane protein
MPTLFAITYPDLDTARQAIESLDWADFDNQIDIKEADWITKEQNELKVHSLRHPAAKQGAIGGGLGLLVGSLFAVPVVGLAAGAAAGIYRAKKREVGIDEAFIESVGATLDSGGSAIILLSDQGADAGRAMLELASYGGTVISNDLSPEQLADIQHVLDQGNLHAEASGDDASKSQPEANL